MQLHAKPILYLHWPPSTTPKASRFSSTVTWVPAPFPAALQFVVVWNRAGGCTMNQPIHNDISTFIASFVPSSIA